VLILFHKILSLEESTLDLILGLNGEGSGHRFNTTFIGTSSDTEITILTPGGTPAVTDNPVTLTLAIDHSVAPTNSYDSVVGVLPSLDVGNTLILNTRARTSEDTTLVREEGVRSLESDNHRTVLSDILHHQLFRATTEVTTNIVDLLKRILALTASLATDTIASLIREALLRDGTEVKNMLTDKVRETTIATLVINGARNNVLGGVTVTVGLVVLDANTRLHGSHESHSIARATRALVTHAREPVVTSVIAPVEVAGETILTDLGLASINRIATRTNVTSLIRVSILIHLIISISIGVNERTASDSGGRFKERGEHGLLLSRNSGRGDSRRTHRLVELLTTSESKHLLHSLGKERLMDLGSPESIRITVLHLDERVVRIEKIICLGLNERSRRDDSKLDLIGSLGRALELEVRELLLDLTTSPATELVEALVVPADQSLVAEGDVVLRLDVAKHGETRLRLVSIESEEVHVVNVCRDTLIIDHGPGTLARLRRSGEIREIEIDSNLLGHLQLVSVATIKVMARLIRLSVATKLRGAGVSLTEFEFPSTCHLQD